jgi:hypothetical protein
VDFEVGFTWSETYFYDVFSSGDRMLMTSPGIAAGGGVGPDGALPSDSTESLVFVINFAENLRGQAR